MLGGGDRHILLEGVLALEFGDLNAREVGFALMSIAIIEATQWGGREGGAYGSFLRTRTPSPPPVAASWALMTM